MSTITLELPDELVDAVLTTPGGLERVRAFVEATFATAPRPAPATPEGADPLAALWGAIPAQGPAPKDLSREVIYADHD